LLIDWNISFVCSGKWNSKICPSNMFKTINDDDISFDQWLCFSYNDQYRRCFEKTQFKHCSTGPCSKPFIETFDGKIEHISLLIRFLFNNKSCVFSKNRLWCDQQLCVLICSFSDQRLCFLIWSCIMKRIIECMRKSIKMNNIYIVDFMRKSCIGIKNENSQQIY
jgi:hypothetical protein